MSEVGFCILAIGEGVAGNNEEFLSFKHLSFPLLLFYWRYSKIEGGKESEKIRVRKCVKFGYFDGGYKMG